MTERSKQTTSRPAQRQKRTQRLNDPRWQLGMACAVTMMLLGAGALYLLGSKLMSSPRLEGALGPKAFEFVRMAADVIFFTAMAAVVHKVIVRLTHSVTGPALVIERGLRGMQKGNFGERLRLRDGDYLTTVADAALGLQKQLTEQRDAVARIVDELHLAAGNEDETRRAIGSLERCFGMDAEESTDEADEVEASDLNDAKAA